MKRVSFIHLLALPGGIFVLGFHATVAGAQDAQTVEAMQRVINAQQRQLEAQQKQLDEQRELLRTLQHQMQSLVKDDETPGDAVAAKLPTEAATQPTVAQPSRRTPLSQMSKYDRKHAASSNIQVGDHSKTIKVADSQTRVGLHGFAELQIIHDSDGIDNNQFETSDISVDGAPSQTKFSVNPTRVEASSATPTSTGQVNSFISMDFNGEPDKAALQLRMAYGEWVNQRRGFSVLAGQTWNTMLDLKALGETLDIAGPAAMFVKRQPLLRVTKAIRKSWLVEAAMDTPENTTYIDANGLSRWPDLVFTSAWHGEGKHFRLAGLARDLRAQDNSGATDSALGWALAGSGKFALPLAAGKDNFKFSLQYGDGYGAQLRDGPADAVFNTGTSELETIGVFSTHGGLQHWWSDILRSNFIYGYISADNPDVADGDVLESTSYAAANLIWNFHGSVTFGLEYLWGRRENKDAQSGTDNRILLSSKFAF
jgi:hypothetical protein